MILIIENDISDFQKGVLQKAIYLIADVYDNPVFIDHEIEMVDSGICYLVNFYIDCASGGSHHRTVLWYKGGVHLI